MYFFRYWKRVVDNYDTCSIKKATYEFIKARKFFYIFSTVFSLYISFHILKELVIFHFEYLYT